MKIAESSPNGYKRLWEKEKLFVTSNFSFSHSVFKKLALQTRKNQSLFGKGLNDSFSCFTVCLGTLVTCLFRKQFCPGLTGYMTPLTQLLSFQHFLGVLRGSVVKCLTRNPGVLGSSRTGFSGFFCGSVLGQDTLEPHPSTGETQERHE